MKSLLVVLACLAVAHADEWKPKTAEEIKTIRADCLKENPISEDLIAKMKKFEFPDEEPVRKYLLCTALKLEIFCTHEGYHADRLAKQFKMDLDENEVLAIAEGCIDKNEQGSSADVWAARGHRCVMASKVGDHVKAYLKRKQQAAAEAQA